jgi:hypothetical protein
MLKGALKDATCGISALTVGLVPTMLPTIAKAENGYTAAQVAEPTEVSGRYELKREMKELCLLTSYSNSHSFEPISPPLDTSSLIIN